jgi:hypothetical protein
MTSLIGAASYANTRLLATCFTRDMRLNMDSLSGDFYGAWKVNEYVDYGLPFTVEYTKEQRVLI